MYDYLIVGAGYAGSVLAERLARDAGKKVLLVDRRPHVAGNAYDHPDAAGVLVHKYGPHIFHTNSREIFDYLSQFTEWRPYEHRVLAVVDGQLLPIPINLDTINRLYGLNLDSAGVEAFFARQGEGGPDSNLRGRGGQHGRARTVREVFPRLHAQAMGPGPIGVDAQVTARVPARTNRDDRYFTDALSSRCRCTASPACSRTCSITRTSRSSSSTDYREREGSVPYREMIYTGPIDEFFDFRFGKLPYRSLEFRHETHDQEVFQAAPVVNYPNENVPYTRITEFKYLTGQEHPKTSIVYEYPRRKAIPYYPIPRPQNAEI